MFVGAMFSVHRYKQCVQQNYDNFIFIPWGLPFTGGLAVATAVT